LHTCTDPPKPDPPPPPPPQTWTPQGPIIPPSEFTPSSSSSSSSSSLLSLSPEIEVMVQQVTAVLPQVPHTVIRKDLREFEKGRTLASFPGLIEGGRRGSLSRA